MSQAVKQREEFNDQIRRFKLDVEREKNRKKEMMRENHEYWTM